LTREVTICCSGSFQGLLVASPRLDAGDAIDELSAAEDQDRGDRADPVRGGRLRVLVDIEIGHVGPALELLGDRLDRRREGTTGWAPRGPEIDPDRAGSLVDAALECRVV
jgi:hypothetical protein